MVILIDFISTGRSIVVKTNVYNMKSSESNIFDCTVLSLGHRDFDMAYKCQSCDREFKQLSRLLAHQKI